MSLPPPSAPTATGWSDSCRAGFAPAEDWRLLTAHTETSLIRAHEPIDLPGPVSRANQAVAFAKSRVLRAADGSPGAADESLHALRCAGRRSACRHLGPPARPRFGWPGRTARTPEPGPRAYVPTEPARPSAVGTPPGTAAWFSTSRMPPPRNRIRCPRNWGNSTRALSRSVAPVVPGVVSRPAARGAPGRHSPCPSRSLPVSCGTSQPAGSAPCAPVSLPCSAPWHLFDLDDRLSCGYRRSESGPTALPRGDSARGQSVIRPVRAGRVRRAGVPGGPGDLVRANYN